MTMHCTHELERFEFSASPAPLGVRNWGRGVCYLRIYQDDQPGDDQLGILPVVVVSELPDNPGPRLRHVIIHVATQAWTELLPALEATPAVVIHWPRDHPERPGRTRSGDAAFLLAVFEIVNPAWRRVRWVTFQTLDLLDLAALIGSDAAGELAAWRCQSR